MKHISEVLRQLELELGLELSKPDKEYYLYSSDPLGDKLKDKNVNYEDIK